MTYGATSTFILGCEDFFMCDDHWMGNQKWRTNCCFEWNKSEEYKDLHLTGIEDVCQPKDVEIFQLSQI